MDKQMDFDRAAVILGVDRQTLPTGKEIEVGVQPLMRSLVEDMSDREWSSVQPLLPALPISKPGVSYADREFLDSVLWYTAARQNGVSWGRLPERYGPESSRRHRWARWCLLGHWRLLADRLRLLADEQILIDRFEVVAMQAEHYRARILEGRRLTDALSRRSPV